MNAMAYEEVEDHVKSLIAEGDLAQAATVIIKRFSPEVLGYYVRMCRTLDLADVTYSQWLMDLWEGLSKFQWRCALRTWIYTLARNARYRVGKTEAKVAGRASPLSWISSDPAFAHAAEEARSRTRDYLRTTVKGELERIRAELKPSEQELLILRVDRALEWNDVAMIMEGWTEEPPPEELRKASAMYRRRYHNLVKRLARQRERLGGSSDSESEN